MLARYMTPAHYWDGMNALLALLARLQQDELPDLLETKAKNATALIGETGCCLQHALTAA